MTSEALSWELERASIFERWDTARRKGLIVWEHGNNESLGAVPDEMLRYREVNKSMDEFLERATPSYLVRGAFRSRGVFSGVSGGENPRKSGDELPATQAADDRALAGPPRLLTRLARGERFGVVSTSIGMKA